MAAKRVGRWLRNAAFIVGGLVVLSVVATVLTDLVGQPSPITGLTGQRSPLTREQRAAVERALTMGSLPVLDELEVDSGTGFVVATFVLTDDYRARLPVSLQYFGEEGLIAIRGVLQPAGYTNYRVNVNGPSPGRGLVSRFGSARSVEGGPIEWLAP